VSLLVAILVQLPVLTIGLSLGGLAGLVGGWVDYVVLRIVEVVTAIPLFLLALFLMSVWRGAEVFGGGSPVTVALTIGMISWIEVCRLTRAQLLSLREKDFVLAATALGASSLQIARTHMLPHTLAAVVAVVTLGIPSAIFTEAGLSCLGMGIDDPLPTWGKMIAESYAYVRVYWYLGAFPALALVVAMLSFTFLGDGLRVALDPSGQDR
jgi:oligopeptide transport system permease protein